MSTTELERLTGGGTLGVRELVDGLPLRAAAPGGRPRVVAAMIASVDGRAAVGGRSVGLGHPADRALLRQLRGAVDAILVGTPTLAAERYADLLDAEHRARRVSEGRRPHPLVATIARGGRLPAGIPLLDEPDVPIVVMTESDAELGPTLDVERFPAGALEPPGVLAALAARGADSVLCEGGPTLLRALMAHGGVDDLLLTVAPLLVAGEAPAILGGASLEPPARMALRDVYRADDHLVLHYGGPG
jgi:riboflavin biosynthesis pyrimidine reductase